MFGGFRVVPPVVSIEAKEGYPTETAAGRPHVSKVGLGHETLNGALCHVEFEGLVIEGLDCRFVLSAKRRDLAATVCD